MNEKLIADLLDDIAERLLKDRECIELLMKEQIESLKLIKKLADAFLAQQTKIEFLNKEMLNFIPDKDRKGNQVIQ